MNDQDEFLMVALREEGLVDATALAEAKRSATDQRLSLGDVLVERRLLTSRQVAMVRAGICEVPYVDIANYRVDLRNASLIGRQQADAACAFPLFVCDGLATVGMINPLDLRAVDQLRAQLKMDVEPVLVEAAALRGLIERVYSMAGGGDERAAADAERAAPELTTGKEPIVALVNQVMAEAAERGASDVHLGPDETRLHLRYRIDGHLQAQQGPPLSAHAAIVQRIKVMANLDLTQTRRPQDGKFRFTHAGRAVDVRVSLIPTVCGENVVLRLLSSAGMIKDFAELGFNAEHTAALQSSLASPNGMILVTGPTGSGKTTTLYSALKQINTPDRNIVTIEDPVEIRLPLVRQVQTNAEIGLTFAGALRSILRQDPDVILVGEIRDEETARIALQAALTGHLVLSSLHTNDAVGAIPRLLDFGCPVFAVSGALLCVVAQRLARRVCADCARPGPVPELVLRRLGLPDGEQWISGSGCSRCGSTGYRGRLGLYEMLKMTPRLQKVMESRDGAAIRTAAFETGLRPMWKDGVDKARLGVTTLPEVLRVASVAAVDTGDERELPPLQPMKVPA